MFIRRKFIVLSYTIFCVVSVAAQQLNNTQFKLLHSSLNAYSFSISVSDFQSISNGDYTNIFVDENFSTLQEFGKPELPIFQQIIAIPNGATPSLHSSSNGILRKSLGDAPLHPAQPHTFKNRETDFTMDNDIYNHAEIYAKPLAEIKELGTLRGLRLLRITVSPFEYNPQKNEILLHNNICVEITFDNADLQATADDLKRYNGLPTFAHVANWEVFEGLSFRQNNKPIKYVIVAPKSFRTTLKAFVEWKRQKGFNVVEMYTNPSDTCTLIRNRLDSLYRTATPIDPAPAFVVIVGDVNHIGTFNGKVRISGIGTHSTDLYYAEYTGDLYPDVAYGRISVADTTELRGVLKKITDYEQYHLTDTTFLNSVVLVAGSESRPPAPTVTNGQINYLNNIYFSQNTNLDTHYYYNPESETKLPQIIDKLNHGASLVNFSSHCLASGWYRPTYTYYGVDTLSNTGKYFFSVNNCCLSSRFSDSCCFGEALLRKHKWASR